MSPWKTLGILAFMLAQPQLSFALETTDTPAEIAPLETMEIQPTHFESEGDLQVETATVEDVQSLVPQAPEIYAEAMGAPDDLVSKLTAKNPNLPPIELKKLVNKTYLSNGGLTILSPSQMEEGLKRTAFEESPGPYYREKIYQNVFTGLIIYSTNQGSESHGRFEVELFTDDTTSEEEALKKSEELLNTMIVKLAEPSRMQVLDTPPESFEMKGHPLRKTTMAFDLKKSETPGATRDHLMKAFMDLPGVQEMQAEAEAKINLMNEVLAMGSRPNPHLESVPKQTQDANLVSLLSNVGSGEPFNGYLKSEIYRDNGAGLVITVTNSSVRGYAAMELTVSMKDEVPKDEALKVVHRHSARVRDKASELHLILADQETDHQEDNPNTALRATTTTLYVEKTEDAEKMAELILKTIASLP